jgi:hypothetical protein
LSSDILPPVNQGEGRQPEPRVARVAPAYVRSERELC